MMVEISDDIDDTCNAGSPSESNISTKKEADGCVGAETTQCDPRDDGKASSAAQQSADKPTNRHQHASATLLLDLAAFATAATDSRPSSGGGSASTTTEPLGVGSAGHSRTADDPNHSYRALSTNGSLQPRPAFPPHFEELGSPFLHAADYASGVALRSNVLGPVTAEIGGKVDEAALVDLVDEYMRGKTIRLERTGHPNKEGAGPSSTSTVVARAQILPVSFRDAPTIASWYNTHGDKVLPCTSKAWNDWWVQRCGHPDAGCEMIKLTLRDDASDHEKKSEEILGIAYIERSVVDRYPIEMETLDENGENCNEDQKLKEEPSGKKRGREKLECSCKSRSIRSTLLRGIRINPKHNPEVSTRFSAPKKDCAVTSGEGYRGIAAALVVHVLSQSLRYGTEAVGVHSPKLDTAEAFFGGLFQGDSRCIDEDEDGRKYFRLAGNNRWEVLQAALVHQVRLLVSDQ